jgi:hyperosmotically inducible periplasmic protein
MKRNCLLALSTLLIATGCHQGDREKKMGASAETQQSMTGGTVSSDTAVPTAVSTTVTNDDASSTAPDNTGKNSRDRTTSALTPLDQGENQTDLTITRRIRRALVSNRQLSSEAKNIEIITANGRVTLRGPVETQQEKQTIDDIAKLIGAAGVQDQLEVKANK